LSTKRRSGNGKNEYSDHREDLLAEIEPSRISHLSGQ
jgi:hypothetical protein